MHRSLAAHLSLLLALVGAAPDQPKLNGPYEVTFAGEWTGTGKVTVGGPNININTDLVDSMGAKLLLKDNGLKIDNYRFTGPGTIGNAAVTISGRIEFGVGDGVPRLVGTVSDLANNRHARFAGPRKNG